MQPKTPELSKKEGICYALSDDGLELPVIDVTHPAFALELADGALDAIIDETLSDLARFRTMAPADIRALAAESILLRGGLQSVGSFMSGMTTYLHKLGPENLGRGYASDWDRRAAGQLLPVAFRLRLRDTAELLSECVVTACATRPKRVRLLNIGGGPALDSINALILANKRAPEALRRVSIVIHLLDIDTHGPAFGARALEALMGEGGPLHELAIRFEPVSYDWSNTAALEGLLGSVRDAEWVAGSSEGGLFEYASDEDIAHNLRVLAARTTQSFAMIGAVLKDKATLSERLKWIGDASGIKVRLLGLGALRELALSAGFAVERVVDGPIHHVVRLGRSA
jgi:hypothetical protein